MLETLQLMGQGFVSALSFINLLAMAGGVALGIVIGCLPGLSAAMGVALMLPLTFTMPADTGLIVLGAIYCGAIFGGSISAILIHTPGTPASAATAIEGYQMTLQGKAGKALATACWSSFWGGLLSCISLYFFAPMLAQLALKFMSAEKFWLGIFGLTIIAGVSSKSIVKGLMSGALGLVISTIGLDPIDGTKRFMFGQAFLAEGINTTCALIGLFSMSQVFILAEKEIKKLKEYKTVIAAKYLPMMRTARYKYTYSIFRNRTVSEIQQLYNQGKVLSEFEYWKLYSDKKNPQEKERICRDALKRYPDFMMAAISSEKQLPSIIILSL